MTNGITLYTVGHSNVAVEVLLGILNGADIETLADIRRYPMSRRNPQFNAATLAATLADAGIAYVHCEALGGRREPDEASANTAIREAQFRGYADHMATLEFIQALDAVLDLAAQAPAAVMCAEAGYLKCHRSLLADAVVARGARVVHLAAGSRTEHTLPPYALVVNGVVTYPALL